MTQNTHATSTYTADRDAAIAPERLERSRAFSAGLRASGADRNGLAVGATAPDFALPNVHGETVRLADLLRDGPVVVTFYRGEWCPYCNLHLRAYQRALPQFQELGATLVAISPQVPDFSLTMAEKNDLQFPVLSDVGNDVARAYGLVFGLDEETRGKYLGMGIDLVKHNGTDAWELPMPGTFMIGQDGVVQLAFVNADYTERLEPAEIVARLQGMQR